MRRAMRNQPRGSAPEKAPCCLYSGRISRSAGSRDSISQPSAKASNNSDCETRRGPSVPGVAPLQRGANKEAIVLQPNVPLSKELENSPLARRLSSLSVYSSPSSEIRFTPSLPPFCMPKPVLPATFAAASLTRFPIGCATEQGIGGSGCVLSSL